MDPAPKHPCSTSRNSFPFPFLRPLFYYSPLSSPYVPIHYLPPLTSPHSLPHSPSSLLPFHLTLSPFFTSPFSSPLFIFVLIPSSLPPFTSPHSVTHASSSLQQFYPSIFDCPLPFSSPSFFSYSLFLPPLTSPSYSLPTKFPFLSFPLLSQAVPFLHPSLLNIIFHCFFSHMTVFFPPTIRSLCTLPPFTLSSFPILILLPYPYTCSLPFAPVL